MNYIEFLLEWWWVWTVFLSACLICAKKEKSQEDATFKGTKLKTQFNCTTEEEIVK